MKSQLSGDDHIIYFCPGCKTEHAVPFKGNHKILWKFNNNFESPTLSPSVKHLKPADYNKAFCHYFIKDGQIQYCQDCDHEFAGKIINLLDLYN